MVFVFQEQGLRFILLKNMLDCAIEMKQKELGFDNKLKIIDRITKKESIKGAPSKQWFYS